MRWLRYAAGALILVGMLRLVDEPPLRVVAQCSPSGRFTFSSALHVDMPVAPMAGFIAACYGTSGVQITSVTISVPNTTLVMADFASPQTGYCIVK